MTLYPGVSLEATNAAGEALQDELFRTLGREVNEVMKTVEGIVDLQLESQVPIEQIQIKFNRPAASQYGPLVGFVTLFGVATRNGLLLVDNYNSKFAVGVPFKEVLISGSI